MKHTYVKRPMLHPANVNIQECLTNARETNVNNLTDGASKGRFSYIAKGAQMYMCVVQRVGKEASDDLTALEITEFSNGSLNSVWVDGKDP